jgi:hypothetical protein
LESDSCALTPSKLSSNASAATIGTNQPARRSIRGQPAAVAALLLRLLAETGPSAQAVEQVAVERAVLDRLEVAVVVSERVEAAGCGR